MAQHGFHNVMERAEASTSNRELPLPTYDEVVGTSRNRQNRRINERPANFQNSAIDYGSNQKSRKKTICISIAILSSVILLITDVIFLLKKPCVAEVNQTRDEYARTQNLYRNCIDDKNEVQRQFDGVSNNIEASMLLKMYKEAVNEKEMLESNIEKLRKQLIKISEERKKEQLTTNLNNYNTQPTVSNLINVSIKPVEIKKTPETTINSPILESAENTWKFQNLNIQSEAKKTPGTQQEV